MKCFYHNEKDAIGICSSCNRGLCPECMVDVDGILACQNSCEERVKSNNLLLKLGKSTHKKTGTAYKRYAIFSLLAGLVFIFWGVGKYFTSDSYGLLIFMGSLGIVFLLGAYHNYKSSKEISKPD